MVGPTNDQPRFFRLFERAVDSGVLVNCLAAASVILAGRVSGAGSYCQKNAASEPNSSISSSARFALLIAEVILPLWRTIPASSSSSSILAWLYLAMRAMLKLSNAVRKFSRFRRIVIHESPA